MSDERGAPRYATALASLTVALAAFALFWVEFLVARPLLPRFGGAPATWLTCLFAFQALLYLGYALAHRLQRWPPVPRALALAGLILSAALGLGLRSRAGSVPDLGWPALTILAEVLASCGLPFLILALAAPLVPSLFAQRWTGARPYALLAASNSGSAAALLLYPTVLEPGASQASQRVAWLIAFGVAASLLLLLCFLFGRRPSPEDAAAPEALPWGQRSRWLLRATVTSLLLHGLTQSLTMDVAAAPLLWVLPLALYLGSFVIAFASSRARRLEALLRVAAPTLAALSALLALPGAPVHRALALPELGLHLLAGGLLFWLVHADLADDAPEPAQLTRFTLDLALGGALGGVLGALAAPLLFDHTCEGSIALLLAAATLEPAQGSPSPRRLTYIGLGLLLGQSLATFQASLIPSAIVPLALTLAGLAWVTRAFPSRSRSGLGLAAACLALGLCCDANGGLTRLLHLERNLYGVIRLREELATKSIVLIHGTTVHGRQSRENPRESTSYYFPGSPVSELCRELGPEARVGVIGLGAGALCAYGQPGQRWTFIELDPAIVRLASDPQVFTYLRDGAAETELIVGDGRLELARRPEARFELLIVDAFSSDAIPIHLLTREALALMTQRLAPGGRLALHISNRLFALAPVVARVAAELGLSARLRTRRTSTEEQRRGWTSTQWIVLAPDEASLAGLSGWSVPEAGDAPLWTDDHASLWSVLRED